ncbi:MAG: nucleotidyltransferase domain-containing protein [Thermodesulfobacteriota bacterium]
MKKPDEKLLNEVVTRINKAVQPVRIILFGSAARAEMTQYSDLDLLVVMPNGTHRRSASHTVYRALRGLGVSKDVIVVTEQDVAEYRNNPSLVLKPALEEGRELYAA